MLATVAKKQPRNSESKKGSTTNTNEISKIKSNELGCRDHTAERCHSKSFSQTKAVCKQNLFLASKKDGDNRPVINLKNLNMLTQYQQFKMEGLYLLKDLLKVKDYM